MISETRRTQAVQYCNIHTRIGWGWIFWMTVHGTILKLWRSEGLRPEAWSSCTSNSYTHVRVGPPTRGFVPPKLFCTLLRISEVRLHMWAYHIGLCCNPVTREVMVTLMVTVLYSKIQGDTRSSPPGIIHNMTSNDSERRGKSFQWRIEK